MSSVKREVDHAADCVLNADWPEDVRRILDNFYWSAFNEGFDAAVELTDHADTVSTSDVPTI